MTVRTGPLEWTEPSIFFQKMNAIVAPLAQAGLGSPYPAPAGLVLLEHTGRRSRKTYKTPLLATVLGTRLLVSTFRGASAHWPKNLAAEPEVQVWVWGVARPYRAAVLQPGVDPPDVRDLPPWVGWLVHTGFPPWVEQGWTFAILQPV